MIHGPASLIGEAMIDWDKKFKAEYDYARGWLASEQNFAERWRPLIKSLYKLMSETGLDAARAEALGDLRKRVTHGEGGLLKSKKAHEDRAILEAVGAWTDDGGGSVEDTKKMRAAALKLLRHTYLLNRSGNRKVWIVSLPIELHDWPSDDLNARAGTQIAARVLLRSSSEIFSAEQKKHLASATQHSLAWCHKTNVVLGLAGKAAGGKAGGSGVNALNLVKRWFADPGTSLPDLQAYIGTLAAGFKKITATINKGHFLLTDWVPLRTASAQDEINFLNAEAFTFKAHGEGMDVVYIERSFFTNHPGNVIHGSRNWTRILVHELTHLSAGTEDVNIGKARYAWYGIGPHAGFPGSAAIRNADSWAFFAADCAGMLTDSERAKALKII